jgi:hypothetical protein
MRELGEEDAEGSGDGGAEEQVEEDVRYTYSLLFCSAWMFECKIRNRLAATDPWVPGLTARRSNPPPSR